VVRAATSAAVRTGFSITGPSPAAKWKGRPITSSGSSRSAKDNGRIHLQDFGGLNGHLRGQFGLLADFDEGMVLADHTVLGHIAASLAHKTTQASSP